ncbi:hypothetical protein D3875_13320 [Deinococcus cavernae]|uniref:Uncharacterized protein n=1 Tax=Deinococcus cavernae TaxID=2320857 RepID=A0A418V8H2_9DEIO|nr:hypothetical protein [Deinococcus cavernae]RJF72384.1 hypothetical protein D3875_13320 [Deinococcus cavernae]
MKHRLLLAGSSLLAFLFAACGTAPTGTLSSQTVVTPPNGTTLTATKTATGYTHTTTTYTWTLQKSVNKIGLEVPHGSTGTLGYTLTYTKTLGGTVKTYGVQGEVCVTNGGSVATENLKIVDNLMYKTGSGPFQILKSFSVDTSAKSVLNPGESHCYAYTTAYTPVDGATYKNSADVTITNHSGSLGTPKGPSPDDGFALTDDVRDLQKNASAVLSDALTCPAGFTCAYAPNPNGTSVSDSGSTTYTVNVTNNTALCNTHVDLVNTASLKPSDASAVPSNQVKVDVYTGVCATGCTLTIGYWKTHAGFGPQPDALSALLPKLLGTAGGAKTQNVNTAAQAVQFLSFNGSNNVFAASNGINKLYAQLLAAKLNIAHQADGSAVSSVIAAADAFLALHDSASWATLSKADRAQVNAWMSALDDYNNGLTGPGHCP